MGFCAAEVRIDPRNQALNVAINAKPRDGGESGECEPPAIKYVLHYSWRAFARFVVSFRTLRIGRQTYETYQKDRTALAAHLGELGRPLSSTAGGGVGETPDRRAGSPTGNIGRSLPRRYLPYRRIGDGIRCASGGAGYPEAGRGAQSLLAMRRGDFPRAPRVRVVRRDPPYRLRSGPRYRRILSEAWIRRRRRPGVERGYPAALICPSKIAALSAGPPARLT